MMKISNKGLDLIKEFEGFRAKPYTCPAGVCTIGYGTTVFPSGKKVRCTDEPITEEFATELLRDMVDRIYAPAVVKAVGDTPTSQEQFDALVSFTYNLGSGNLNSSTLLRRHNEENYELASGEFKKWNKAGGKVLAGLTRRREEEEKLYVNGSTIKA